VQSARTYVVVTFKSHDRVRNQHTACVDGAKAVWIPYGVFGDLWKLLNRLGSRLRCVH